MVACEGNTRHLAEEWNLLSLFPLVSCEFQSNVRLGEASEGGSREGKGAADEGVALSGPCRSRGYNTVGLCGVCVCVCARVMVEKIGWLKHSKSSKDVQKNCTMMPKMGWNYIKIFDRGAPCVRVWVCLKPDHPVQWMNQSSPHRITCCSVTPSDKHRHSIPFLYRLHGTL